MGEGAEAVLRGMEQFVNPGLARVYRFMGLDAVEADGEGAVVRDEEGREYLDCAGGYGVFIHGYRHPRLLAAARRQLERLPLSSRVLMSRPAVELAELLAAVTPGDLRYSFFVNSGAEAVEAALKFARAATGRPRLIACHGAFHGKTLGALSVTGRALYQDPFRPLVPEVSFVPYGDSDALAAAMDDRVAAVIVEPIQGEGGVVVPPPGYLPAVRAITRKWGSLLIVDEVQTGMGRTGWLWACQNEPGVDPDLLCISKGLSGGVVPVGAVVGTPQVWRFLEEAPLIHTSTFGGNPLACAVAAEAIRVVVEEGLAERARAVGDAWLLPALKAVAGRHPRLIREVRGRGLMIGLETAAAGVAGALMAALFQRRILAVYTLNNDRVIRLLPPLVIARSQLERVLDALEEALSDLEAVAEDLLDED
jgi:putrescine aminotransferase